MSVTGRELRILHINDSEDDAFLTRRALERGGLRVNFQRVDSLGDFETQLDAGHWDLVLCDYELKSFGARHALQSLAAYQKAHSTSDIPFIVLAGSIGEDNTADLMRRGARDYINKNKLNTLAAAVERELIAARIRHHNPELTQDGFSSNQLHTAVFEAAPDPILVLDLKGGIIDLNSAALELFSMDRDSCSGMNITELTAWRNKPLVESLLKKHRSGLHIRNAEILSASHDQQEHLISWSIDDVELDSVARVLWFGRDITHMRAAEQNLLRRRKNEALCTFGAGLSHDLHTTFSDVLMLTGKATRRGAQDEELSRYHRGIQASASAGAHLVQRIAYVSNVHTGKELARPVALLNLMREALFEFERQIPENIRIRSRLTGEHIIAIHPALFQEMLTNIFANATAAIGVNGGEIQVRVEDAPPPQQLPQRSPANHVHISVSDSGHGILPEHLERVLDPYFTTKSSTDASTPEKPTATRDSVTAATRVPGSQCHGVGLGLSLVHRIVTDLNGELSLRSLPGEGCTVTLTLPCVEEPLRGGESE
ncbi:MAG: PAS domain S-box protein [Spirochaeta sp.]|nr:PAS domain S-box protein [Spirochaeta sp.]